jgi:hypothetical protein
MNINHQLLNRNFFPTWPVKTLILGTFNPECGDNVDYFYGRQSNNFWKAIKLAIIENNAHSNPDDKFTIMKDFQFGCTDIIKSIKIQPEKHKLVCGSGYSDSILFTKKYCQPIYNFDDIKNFLINNKIEKVLQTWGKRNSPKFFREQVEDLKEFCITNKIKFIFHCPSPSGRFKGKERINKLKNFYENYLFEFKN